MSSEKQHTPQHEELLKRQALEQQEVKEVLVFIRKYAKPAIIALVVICVIVLADKALKAQRHKKEVAADSALMQAKNPADLQAIVRVACQAAVMDTLSDFTYNNGVALMKLIDDHDVELRRFPDEVLNQLGTISSEFIREMATESELMGRIFASYQAYMDIVSPWTDISERTLLNLRPELLTTGQE